ncbi:hypothetical protein D3C71_1371260 [compost metagenome]
MPQLQNSSKVQQGDQPDEQRSGAIGKDHQLFSFPSVDHTAHNRPEQDDRQNAHRIHGPHHDTGLG